MTDEILLKSTKEIVEPKIELKEAQQEAKGLKADRKSNLTAFHSSIDLFEQNVGVVCPEDSLRCSWISLVLIYLIKLWV